MLDLVHYIMCKISCDITTDTISKENLGLELCFPVVSYLSDWAECLGLFL